MANNIEAFLRARGKNHTEDVRLQQTLSTYELEKKQWERRTFNESYEQRKYAYNLKRESDEVIKKRKDKKKRKGDKYEVSQDVDVVDAATNTELPPLERRASRPAAEWTEVKALDTLPAVDTSRIASPIKSPTKMAVTNPLPDLDNGKSGGKANQSQVIITGTQPQSRKQNFIAVVEAVINAGARNEELKPSDQSKAAQSSPAFRPAQLSLSGNPRLSENKEPPSPTKKVRLADVVARLFPKSLRRARSMEALEALKENALPRGALTGRAMADGERVEDEEEEPAFDPLQGTTYWVGDPKAIGSVRRPRKPPEVMSARSKNIGDVMKMIRDLPVYPSCSKNCNKPGACFEELSGEQQNMLPSLVIANVARHYLKTSRASSLETLAAVNNTQQVVSFPAVPQDATLAARSVQRKIERSMEEQRQSLRRAQRELTKNAQANRSTNNNSMPHISNAAAS